MAPDKRTTNVCSVIGTGVNPNGILNGATAASNAANNAAKTNGLRLSGLSGVCFLSGFFWFIFLPDFFAIKAPPDLFYYYQYVAFVYGFVLSYLYLFYFSRHRRSYVVLHLHRYQFYQDVPFLDFLALPDFYLVYCSGQRRGYGSGRRFRRALLEEVIDCSL